MPPSLTAAVADEFTRTAREKGARYAASGRVRVTSASPDAVDAVVSGTVPYRVTVARKPDGGADALAFEVSCECPYFAQELSPCKHLWAVFSVAERDGHLTAGGPIPPHAYLDVLEAEPPPIRAGSRRPPPPRPSDPGTLALARLEAHVRERAATTPAVSPLAGRELLYVIEPPTPAQAATRTGVRVMTRVRKKNGEWSKPKAVSLREADIASAPPADRSILATLRGAEHSPYSSYAYGYASLDASYAIPPALAADLLPAMARTGRALVEFFAAAPGTARDPFQSPPLIRQPIRWDDGPPWRFAAAIARTDGGWRIDGRLERSDEWLNLADVLAIDESFVYTRETLARADVAALPLVHEIWRARGLEVPDALTPRLALVIAQLGVPAADIPDALRIVHVDAPPQPQLRLHAQAPAPATLVAEIAFRYAETIVAVPGAPTSYDEARRAIVVRRPADEQAALDDLVASGFHTGWNPRTRQPRWELPARQLTSAVRTLLPKGWHIEAEGKPVRAARGVRLSVTSGIDWFDLDATVDFGDASAPLTDVIAALARREQTIRLGDGSTGLLPEDWLRRYLPLAAAGETIDARLRFRQPQAALLDALLAEAQTHAEVDVDTAFQRARDALVELGRIPPADPPETFAGTLRDYQREGLAWLRFLARAGFGGCLADDMGLGKTIMVLALLLGRQDDPDRGDRPSLIVVPRSLVSNWLTEAARFTPALRVRDYSGAGRSTGAFDGAHVLLTTYGTLRRDVLTLKDVDLDYVILDEAQAIKNALTSSAKAARLLRARHRLALTGTPIENHLGELWSLFEFLNPGVLGRSTFFKKASAAAGADADTLRLLARGLRPFILRRTKQQVARELPARTEQTIFCELSKPERAVYEQLRQHYRASVLAKVERDGVKRSQMHVLEALLRLRQAACHPSLVRDVLPAARRHTEAAAATSSAKIDMLLSRLQEVLEEGHKALVFSQFTSLLTLVRQPLDAQRIGYAYLDGRTRDRASNVERFQQDPDCRLFLISLKAGGVGLNLTAAEYVFLLDPWWNPAVEAQAIDRAHRIGQSREVFAYRLVASDTIESKILELQERKRALADAILTPGGGLKGLDLADLERLLG